MNCRECHWENPLNDGGQRATISGLPASFKTWDKYEVTVELRHPNMKIAGFQLSTRFDSGTSWAGKQAGTIRPLDTRTQVAKNDTTGVSYISHTRAGTALAQPGMAAWTFEWTAPATQSGAVIVHLAANAADDTNSEGGDYIYLTTTRIAPPPPLPSIPLPSMPLPSFPLPSIPPPSL
jgi:hypothetical protein